MLSYSDPHLDLCIRVRTSYPPPQQLTAYVANLQPQANQIALGVLEGVDLNNAAHIPERRAKVAQDLLPAAAGRADNSVELNVRQQSSEPVAMRCVVRVKRSTRRGKAGTFKATYSNRRYLAWHNHNASGRDSCWSRMSDRDRDRDGDGGDCNETGYREG